MFVLRDYQNEAIQQIMDTKHKLIKLPAGTGKSQILYECINRVSGNILIIAPKYVLSQHRSVITKDAELITPNYLVLHPDKFLSKHYSLICIDESHIIKNFRSKTDKVAFLLSEVNPDAVKIAMTATPYRENVGEVYGQIYFVNPHTKLGNKKQFVSRYERDILCGSYWKKTYIHTQELLTIAAQDVYTKSVPMPEQVIKDVVLDMPDELLAYYTKAKKECWLQVQDKVYFFTAALWVKLQQLASGFTCQTVQDEPQLISKYKWESIKEIVDNLNSNVIIWSNMRFELEQLHKLMPYAGLVMGGIKCEKTIQDFKDGKINVLIANPDCIGAGVSLECCHHQIISSCGYSGIKYYQTIKRTNRLSQKHQEIIYRVYYKNTIQERVFKSILEKEMSDDEFMRVMLLDELK